MLLVCSTTNKRQANEEVDRLAALKQKAEDDREADLQKAETCVKNFRSSRGLDWDGQRVQADGTVEALGRKARPTVRLFVATWTTYIRSLLWSSVVLLHGWVFRAEKLGSMVMPGLGSLRAQTAVPFHVL